MNCLFCCDPDTDDKPIKGKYLICFLCVQTLLEADQKDLKRAHSAAIERGYERKAKAIESFLFMGEITDERNAKKPKRGSIRKKPMRVVRPTRNKLRS